MIDSESIFQLLDKSYDFNNEEIVSLKKIKRKSINEVYELMTGKNKYIIKIYNGNDSRKIISTLNIQSDVQKYLDAAPEVLKNIECEYVTSIDSNSFLSIQRFVSGKKPSHQMETIEKVAEGLATIHSLLSRTSIDKDFILWDYNFILKNYETHRDYVVTLEDYDYIKPEFIHLFDIRREKFLTKFTKTYHFNSFIQYIHGDIRPANILMSEENKPYFLDFDYAKPFDILIEIGLAAMVISNFNMKKIISFYEKYREFCVYKEIKQYRLEQIFENTLAYLVANNFPANIFQKLEKKHLETVVHERIKMIETASEIAMG